MREFNIVKKNNKRALLKKYIPIKIQDLTSQFEQIGQDWTFYGYKWKIIKTKNLERDKKLGPNQPALTLLLDVYFLEERETPPHEAWLFRKFREWKVKRANKPIPISPKLKSKLLAG